MLKKTASNPQNSNAQTTKPAGKSDQDIFYEAMKEVREIQEFRKMSVLKKAIAPSNCKNRSAAQPLHELEDIVRGKGTIRLSDTQEYVEWVSPKYHREIIKELHRGRFAVQDYIDLHGYVLDDAEMALQDFLLEAKRRGHRCIKIIHGRGLRSPDGPVLKKAVIDFLSSRYRKNVIGFSTARQNDGGLGALYVLLK